jgi:hypothetical protein
VFFVNVASSDDLAFFEREKGLIVAGAHVAAADHSHGDALRRSGRSIEAEGAGRNESGKR